jgi:uncharacterized membrane protein
MPAPKSPLSILLFALIGMTAFAEPVDFLRDLKPIIEGKCVKCHNPDKDKGTYELHTFAKLMSPGDEELEPVVPGNPDDSFLFELIATDDEDDRMPPKGDGLSTEEIALFENWILEGAKFDGDHEEVYLVIPPPEDEDKKKAEKGTPPEEVEPADENPAAGTNAVAAAESEAAETAETKPATEEPEAPTEDKGNFIFWIGHFHPVVLHLPIGLLIGLFIVELYGLIKRTNEHKTATYILTMLCALSGVLATLLGLALASEGGYTGDTVFWHKWTGIGVSVATVIMWIGKHFSYVLFKARYTVIYSAALLVAMVLLPIAGHFGGELSHGSAFLFTDIPKGLGDTLDGMGIDTHRTKKVISSEAAGQFFTEKILPVMEKKCFGCHGEEKQKGDLRMDSLAAILKAGESEIPCVVPESAMESYLVEVILLPLEDEAVMPPEGKPALTAEEKILLVEWISRGAIWPEEQPEEQE